MQFTIVLIYSVCMTVLYSYKSSTNRELSKQAALLRAMREEIINEHKPIKDKITLSRLFSIKLREEYDEYISRAPFLSLQDAINGISEIYKTVQAETEYKKAELEKTGKVYTVILSLCALIAIVILI